MLGAPIKTVAWLPMWCDTPGVVANLEKQSFSFSGGVLLVSESDQQVCLTWDQQGNQFVLVVAENSNWPVDYFDRVQCSFRKPWDIVRGAELRILQSFASVGDDARKVVGVRHTVFKDDAATYFWVGCGGPDWIGDGDDLWVSIGVEPPNILDLIDVTPSF